MSNEDDDVQPTSEDRRISLLINFMQIMFKWPPNYNTNFVGQEQREWVKASAIEYELGCRRQRMDNECLEQIFLNKYGWWRAFVMAWR